MDKNNRWIRVLHLVDPGYYSMRNRNWIDYECPQCANRQEYWGQRCNNRGTHLLMPDPDPRQIKIVEE